MKIEKFNDVLALLLVILIVGFITAGAVWRWDNKVADMATGALIAILTLVAQYYFRRAKPEDK